MPDSPRDHADKKVSQTCRLRYAQPAEVSTRPIAPASVAALRVGIGRLRMDAQLAGRGGAVLASRSGRTPLRSAMIANATVPALGDRSDAKVDGVDFGWK
jgi:hypothetical protein